MISSVLIQETKQKKIDWHKTKNVVVNNLNVSTNYFEMATIFFMEKLPFSDETNFRFFGTTSVGMVNDQEPRCGNRVPLARDITLTNSMTDSSVKARTEFQFLGPAGL